MKKIQKFTFHPPTRTVCPVCDELHKNKEQPLIPNNDGKASSSSNFPIYNWYYFVLGYTPDFPNYIIEREKINSKHFVVDPFMGAGTSLIACKENLIRSSGIDANDYFIDVVETKITWDLNLKKLKPIIDQVLSEFSNEIDRYASSVDTDNQPSLFSKDKLSYETLANEHRTEMMTERYISNIPFAKLIILKMIINSKVSTKKFRAFFDLALSSIIVPVSNVRYGPGFGVGKAKLDADVFGLFKKKIERMFADLSNLTKEQIATRSEVKLGDSRLLSKYYEPNSVNFMITSPPYPGDHEYTKHTRLELIFMEYAQNLEEFRTIKQRMIRGSTTNIYKGDNDIEFVKSFESIQKITSLIDKRLEESGATSGFEKLYSRSVWEYFGGMYRMLVETKKVLKKGGKISLLVSDSHAFKMVHICTAKILAEIAIDIGYKDAKIELWQDKVSTSHNYYLREDILTLTK